MGLEEGTQPAVNVRMEVVPIEGSVGTAGENDGEEKEKCSAAVVDLNLQEDRTVMIVKLTGEIKRGFSVSEANQASIKEMFEALESKFDLLAKRTQLLEDSMETLLEEVVLIKQDLRKSKDSEQDLRDKLERIENAARRNNLSMLNIPEGQEGDNIKMFCASLIKKSQQLEESER
ncbi:hypothetical protein NDU88_002487 [Pleurodeles waltl]|uniref:Uncharacterized protein n=1 Tax=Pleurodeles waltl TaxID=8319 RepID=A0AAV7TL93_PLEWA|nr:hypothetical protein NDU88_002487 [Pleurodeles waltl]